MSYHEQLVGTLRLKWERIGEVGMEADGKLRFPKISAEPGLYRFLVRRPDGTGAVYIGETDSLQRRFAHYRNPGPTQTTNLRLNSFFKSLLSDRGSIEVSISTREAWIKSDGVENYADLRLKNVRRLFENFALSMEKAGDLEGLNR